jgi:uncharacterized protein (DUF1697 family)
MQDLKDLYDSVGLTNPQTYVQSGNEEIYVFCPGGYGRTKLSNNYFERQLGVPATTRNWKTVLALHEMARERL